jgi:nitroreductase
MKKIVLCLMLLLILALQSLSQDLQPIKLNAPNLDRGSSIMKAFKERSSTKEFDTQKISIQDLSDLLWAANGINRPESGKRTAPSAMNVQDIDIYVLLEEGSYLYDAKENVLKPVATGDQRQLFSGPKKDPVNIPLILILISDISRFKRGADSLKLSYAAMDAGIVSQNIALFCAGNGILTRPRASMPIQELKKTLKLTATQYPILNNPVSYKKK